MRPERIEELLRTKPPGEPDHPVRPVDTLTTGALRAANVRPAAVGAGGLAWAATVLIAAIGVTIGAIVLRNGPAGPSPSPVSSGVAPSLASGVIPWTDATPGPSPTPEPTPDAASLPACMPDDLVLVAGGWEGATGSMAGSADILNVSANPCHIVNALAAQLSDAAGTIIAGFNTTNASGGSGAGVVAVPSGGDVTGTLVWMNWCDAAPRLPLTLTVYLADASTKGVSPDAPRLTAEVQDWNPGGAGLPRCDAPGSGSSVGSVSFRPPEPSSADYQPEACDASGLAAFSGWWGAAAGSSYANLVVLNDGGLDCVLPTTPTLELRDAHGTLIASSGSWPETPATVVLPAGWTAVAMMVFSDWCASPPALPLTLDLGLGLRLPALQVVQSNAQAVIPVPWCGSAPATPPPFFGYNLPFTVPGMPIVEPSTDPGDTLPVTVAISSVPPTAPGSVLEYSVTLTSVSPYDKPMNLEVFCPTYVQRLFVPGVDASLDTTRSLNCGPAGTLAGGASVTFEMRLAIPSDAAAGTASIVWQLGQRGPAAKVQFQIRP